MCSFCRYTAIYYFYDQARAEILHICCQIHMGSSITSCWVPPSMHPSKRYLFWWVLYVCLKPILTRMSMLSWMWLIGRKIVAGTSCKETRLHSGRQWWHSSVVTSFHLHAWVREHTSVRDYCVLYLTTSLMVKILLVMGTSSWVELSLIDIDQFSGCRY